MYMYSLLYPGSSLFHDYSIKQIPINILRKTQSQRIFLHSIIQLSVAFTLTVAISDDIQIENVTSIAASNVMLVHPSYSG